MSAENALLKYEGGQNAVAMAALTDSGDATTFTTGDEFLSSRAGFEPDVRPDGVISGGVISPAASASSDVVDVAAISAYVGGVKVTAGASTDLAVARPSTQDHIIYSITIDNAGAIAALAGTEGTAFVETRDAAGGPPYIPVGKVEVGQVRLSSQTSAVVKASEILQVIGLHQERYDSPFFTIDYRNGEVKFNAALQKIHTGGTARAVYASYATAIFADASKVSAFVPSETSHSSNSTQIYGTTLASSSSSLSQASFTAYLNDGVSDPLVKLKNENLWFKFFPDRNRTNYIVEHGKLGIARTFPAADNIQASCTISVEEVGQDVTT
jgi:hypothetical protein